MRSSRADFMIGLFEGAANVARLELGASSTGPTDVFLRWMTTRLHDPDIVGDLQMMVPVYRDVGRNRTKVWMFMGWLADTLAVRFERPPRVEAPGNLDLTFGSASHAVATPVIVEGLVRRVLDRDEFRRVCDCHGTPEAVVRAVR